MKIGVFRERKFEEKRVALVPATARKLVDFGHEIFVEKDAGKESSFLDKAYIEAGCHILDRPQVLEKSDIAWTLHGLEGEELKKNSVLIGLLKPSQNKGNLKNYCKENISALSMELLPRITRAQSMDVLSSQANLAGYRCVIEAASLLRRAFPLMMTPAGTVPATRVLILGCGVAGLQAIATAKRLGSIVTAFDVRPEVKEQAESLGASFITVDNLESGAGTGGYAKEMDKGSQDLIHQKLSSIIANQDAIITTAQIPGKPAPKLITKEMVQMMKPGSVIIDLAGESGGNCGLSEWGQTKTKHDVTISAPLNILASIPENASSLYSQNLFHFFKILFKEDGMLNQDDVLVQSTLLTHEGLIVHPNFKEL